jgi:hypothetical protein
MNWYLFIFQLIFHVIHVVLDCLRTRLCVCVWGPCSVWRSNLWKRSRYMLHSSFISIQWLSIGNRTRDLPACTIAHQPSTLSHAPRMFCIPYKSIILLIRTTLDFFRAKELWIIYAVMYIPSIDSFPCSFGQVEHCTCGASSRPCRSPQHLKLVRRFSCSLHFEMKLRNVTIVVWLPR